MSTAPSTNGSVWSHVRHWFQRRPSSVPSESRSETYLRQQVEQQETDLRNLRLEVSQLQSALRVAQLEIQLQADVIERDRRRVIAETAVHAYTEARATTRQS